jgi:Methyltransferase domain
MATTNTWDDFASLWKKYEGSSVRPNKFQTSLIEKVAQQKLVLGSKALVMGSTPELRDVLAKYPVQVYIMDMNLEMMRAMSELAQNVDIDKEIWVKSGWLNDVFEENKFDLIVADWTSANLPFELQEKYYKNIAKWLKKDGLIVERLYVFDKQMPEYTFENLISDFKDVEVTFASAAAFWDVGIAVTNQGPASSRLKKVSDFKRLLEDKTDNPIVKKFIDLAGWDFYPEDKIWFIPEKEDLLVKIGKHLNVKELVVDQEVEPNNVYKYLAPIGVFTKK